MQLLLLVSLAQFLVQSLAFSTSEENFLNDLKTDNKLEEKKNKLPVIFDHPVFAEMKEELSKYMDSPEAAMEMKRRKQPADVRAKTQMIAPSGYKHLKFIENSDMFETAGFYDESLYYTGYFYFDYYDNSNCHGDIQYEIGILASACITNSGSDSFRFVVPISGNCTEYTQIYYFGPDCVSSNAYASNTITDYDGCQSGNIMSCSADNSTVPVNFDALSNQFYYAEGDNTNCTTSPSYYINFNTAYCYDYITYSEKYECISTYNYSSNTYMGGNCTDIDLLESVNSEGFCELETFPNYYYSPDLVPASGLKCLFLDPTNAPTAAPITPTYSPSRNPTYSPTTTRPTTTRPSVAPSAIPTVNTKSPTFSPVTSYYTNFRATQVISGLTAATYYSDPSYETGLITAIVNSVSGITSSNIYDITVTDYTSSAVYIKKINIETIQTTSSSISVSYTIYIIATSSSESYTTLSTELSSAVTSGQFTTYLQSAYTGYASASTSSVSIDDLGTNNFSDDDDNDDESGLSSGDITGIVSGIICGFAIFFFVIVFCVFKKTQTPPEDNNNNHHYDAIPIANFNPNDKKEVFEIGSNNNL